MIVLGGKVGGQIIIDGVVDMHYKLLPRGQIDRLIR
jgi:hypothetical protein